MKKLMLMAFLVSFLVLASCYMTPERCPTCLGTGYTRGESSGT